MQPTRFQTITPEKIVPIDSLVDTTNNLIASVSVISVGPALGHGMMIDLVTLQQVMACAERYQGGLKVKLNHSGEVDDIVGFLNAFRVSTNGTKLLADLHILENTPYRDYIFEIARKMPESFGLSIAFSGMAEERNGIRYARCSEIYSADIVDQPAANPGGLFSRRFDEWAKSRAGTAPISTSSPATKTSNIMDNEILSQIGKMIDDKLAAVSASFDAKLASLKGDADKAYSRIDEVAKLSDTAADKAALAAVKEFAKTLGAPAGNAAAPSAPPAAPAVKKFEELVKEHTEYAKSKAKAQAAVIASHPAEYSNYRARCMSGEIILF
jgi:hypothetical protein